MKTMRMTFVLISISMHVVCDVIDPTTNVTRPMELPKPLTNFESEIYYITAMDNLYEDQEERRIKRNTSSIESNATSHRSKTKKHTNLHEAVQIASLEGLQAMIDLYENKEPNLHKKGELLPQNHPATILSLFSAPIFNDSQAEAKGAFASLYAAKKLEESLNLDFTGYLGRQNDRPRISLKRTSLEGLCPPRDLPQCSPATKRYRTHDGTCNNQRRSRWGSAQLPFHRFLPPDYADGLEEVRGSFTGGKLPSARFISLLVHGYREEEASITMLLPQWGQFIDHDITSTVQPRSVNGSIPKCCKSENFHPSCLPIQVPRDDPWLSSLGVRCLEFLRSAPAQRRDCFLSWREQTNQATSYIDASPVYSSNPRQADNSRIQRDGLLLFGRGNPRDDPCLRGGFGHQCIRAGDSRAGEQPGLLAMHTIFVAEHNRITLELVEINPHWSDEKLYQETRRIIGAIFQHITYREFLPLVLGIEVVRVFDLELEPNGFYHRYDPKTNPSIANSFAAAAFRFGHSLIPSTIMRGDANHRFINNNVSLHDENSEGDIGTTGSLHRILRGMAKQRTLKRDEFMSPELTNHLFQANPFPFGMDLAAINIQRGRDHGLPTYLSWREPCGLSRIESWEDLTVVVGPKSSERIRNAYQNLEDIDLFVGGISERPVVGGLVGPVFACIIAQQFSNLRKGDRFWYENAGFESSFTSSQLSAIKSVTLSQIICRSLGSSNFMQPHAFLPSDLKGNERQRCGSGINSPINLHAWAEHDPFHKQNDHESNFILSNGDEFTIPVVRPTTTKKPNKPIVDRVDFISENPLTTSKTTLTTLKVQPFIDNKLDFTTTKRKQTRKPLTTTRPKTTKLTFAIISNKLDLDIDTTLSSKRPIVLPFSKLNNISTSNLTLTTKHPAKGKNKKRPVTNRRNDDLNDDDTDNIGTIRVTDHQPQVFYNQDNATKYMNNNPIYSLSDTLQLRSRDESRQNYGSLGQLSLQQQNQYNDYDYERYTKPNYYTYPQRPYTYSSTINPTTTRRPVIFQNNKPNYYNFLPDARPANPDNPTDSPLSLTKVSTPFSYDTYQSGSSVVPQINYENMAIPLYVSANRINTKPVIRPSYQQLPSHQTQQTKKNYYNQRPTYATTRKVDLQTFLIVDTTRRTPTPLYIDLKRTTPRPYITTRLDANYYPVTPQSTNYYYSSSGSSVYNQEHGQDYPVKEPTNFSNNYFLNNIRTTTRRTPIYQRPSSTFNVQIPASVFSDQGVNDGDSEYDGYLRPEHNDYVPLTNNQKASYTDYSQFNSKPYTDDTTKNIKYYYMGNVLHEKYLHNNPNDGLYSKQNKRYAGFYDKNLLTEPNDEKTHIKMTTDNDKKRVMSIRRLINDNVLIIPFRVLTKPERPDNWVNTENIDGTKTQLPDVPALDQDNDQVSLELPRPHFSKSNEKN